MLSFVACLIVGQIRSTALRKIFSTALGFGLGFYNYGLLFLINVASIIVCFMLIRFNSRVNGANLVTWWGAIFMISVSFHHHHIAHESGTLSLDLIFMMNFVKIHMFAVNYENAGKLDDPSKSINLTPREKLFAEPLRNKVIFIDWINYFFFVGSSWTGMCHEYKDFDDYINSKEGFANIPRQKIFTHAFTRFA